MPSAKSLLAMTRLTHRSLAARRNFAVQMTFKAQSSGSNFVL